MSLMEEWDSYRELVEQSQRARLSIPNINVEQPSTSHDDDSDEEVYPPSLLSPLDLEVEVCSTNLSTPLSSPPESILDFGDAEMLEMVVSDSGMSTETEMENKAMVTEPPRALEGPDGNPEGPVIYHRNIPVFSVQSHTVETEDAVQSVMSCSETCLTSEVPQMVTENYCFVVDGEKLTAQDLMQDTNWWRPTGRPTKYYYSTDLKTFQRVNIILVKGRVISARLTHTRTTPPPSTDRQRASVQSTATGRSLSVSSGGAPVRRASFSFYYSSPKMGPQSGSSSPAQFNPATGLRSLRFHQHRHSSTPVASCAVQPGAPFPIVHRPSSVTSFVSAGGQQRQHPSPMARFVQHYPSYQQFPHPSPPTVHTEVATGRSMEVPLNCVYKVTRLYSFWKTCTSFHRIITVITPLTEPHANPQYKRRMFVQYLWRNAKEADKLRVQREFDPKKNKPFNPMHMRDPLTRKRTFHF